MPNGFRWWQSGVIYQIYPRSFADANGDGVGDLAGITSRLDHLRDLGVDALWLSPVYPSPGVDFGYDVTDHTAIDPLFGDLADFDALVDAAHVRDLRVLLDFIPNHTSDQHSWFTASRSARSDPKRNWYLWADPAADGGPPNNWRSVFGGSAWTLDEATGQYFYHAYLPQQPDLNWREPQARQAQLDVMRFWLDRGVDGFRIDACRQLLKDDHLRDNPPNPNWRPAMPPYDALIPLYTTDHADAMDIVTMFRAVVDEYPGGRVLLAELYLPVERLMRYYGRNGDDGLHLPSNMAMFETPWRPESIAALAESYEAALPARAWPNWVLGNHDRSRLATRIGAAQARVAAVLLLTLRGTPILYYGEEIAMHDVPIAPELVRDPYELRVPGIGVGRDPERTPMQWAPTANAGFCAESVSPWLPIPADANKHNVAIEATNDASMLTLYRRLLALRRTEPALSVGSYRTLRASDGVLAYLREHDGSRIAVVLNLTDRPQSVDLPAGALLLSTDPRRTGPDGNLAPDEALLIRC